MFEFKIGESVYLNVGVDDVKLSIKLGQFTIPQCFTVLEHVTKTCHGGTQYFYVIGQNGAKIQVSADEVCGLEAFDIEEAVAIISATRKARRQTDSE